MELKHGSTLKIVLIVVGLVAGGWVTRFENQREYTDAPHVVAVTNGTVALRLAPSRWGKHRR